MGTPKQPQYENPSDIADRDIPTLGLPDPDFSVIGQSDGRAVSQNKTEDTPNPRKF